MYPSWFSTRPFSWIDRASSSEDLSLLELGASLVPESAAGRFAAIFSSNMMVDAGKERKTVAESRLYPSRSMTRHKG